MSTLKVESVPRIAVVGELGVLLDHQVDVDGLHFPRLVAGVRQHPFDDAVGALAVFVHLDHVGVEVSQDLVEVFLVDFAITVDGLRQLLPSTRR